MGLNTPAGGLGNPTRRLRNVSISAEKVTLTVASGDELIVTEDVAAQLERASGAFVDSDSDRAARAVAGLEAIAADQSDEPADEVPTDPPPVAKKAAKRAAKKAAG